ncbi:hypothetical protein MOO44_08630 [Nicoliella spurrieriana]|uniref:Uncharacterized protein n=1 Tax=Nicoliella spurrieriana TaxID=2925830 RepID=A0A976RS86_9LACO|nr:hypothetical protein [Nicoliella spurrieriana]UQS86913.1 hypothetical protein MOO44_08630 [Nicoliella spurrieriana]
MKKYFNNFVLNQLINLTFRSDDHVIKKIILYITTATLFAGVVAIATNSGKSVKAATWKTGVPEKIINKANWVTKYQKVKHPDTSKNGRYYYQKGTIFANNMGYSASISFFNKAKMSVGAGIYEKTSATKNPHYLQLGNGKYLITSGGDGHGAKSLQNELKGTSKHNHGKTILFKFNKHNSNKATIWSYDKGTSGKKTLEGHFKAIGGKG